MPVLVLFVWIIFLLVSTWLCIHCLLYYCIFWVNNKTPNDVLNISTVLTINIWPCILKIKWGTKYRIMVFLVSVNISVFHHAYTILDNTRVPFPLPQCRKLGLLAPEETLPDSCRRKFQQAWANTGDAISKQYAGTVALKVRWCLYT